MKARVSLFFKSAVIFLVFFSLFLGGHFLTKGFTSSDDPYYHAKHALLIEQSGKLNLVEPWLEFHFFNYAPTDPWWGFHLGEALFIHWFGLMAGVKIYASFLAGLVFLVFYLILNRLDIKYPEIFTGFLFFSSAIFGFRLFLERPHLLSMIVMPLALFFLFKKKNWSLFILAIFYTLSYHLAPLLIFQTIAYLAVDFYVNKRLNLKPLIASSAGFLVGALIHPQGLNYLYVMLITVGQIMYLKLTGVNLSIGTELRIIGFPDFLAANFLVVALWSLAITLFLSLRKNYRDSVKNNFLFLYSSFWLIVTLLVNRGVEFWLPMVILFSATQLNSFVKTEEFRLAKIWLRTKTNLKVVVFFIVSILMIIVFNNLNDTFFNLYQVDTDKLSSSYEQANDWLKANTEKDSVIFYNSWGMWPMMFFYNDYNHYLIGMDPTLTYEFNHQYYWIWQNISYNGLYCDRSESGLNLSAKEQINLAPTAIRTVFQSKYAVVLNQEQGNLIKTFNSLKSQVKLVFKNDDLLIYEIL